MLSSYWQSRKIRTKILLTLLPMALLFLLTIGISFQSARNTSINHFHKTMSLMLQNGSKELDQFILSSYQAFRKISQYDIYGLAIQFNTMRELKSHFDQLRTEYPIFKHLVLTDVQGKILYATETNLVGEQLALNNILTSPNPISVQYTSMLQPLDKPIVSEKTYRFRAICKNYKGDVNGVLLAYLDWSMIQTRIDAFYQTLSRHSFQNAKVALLDLTTEGLLAHSAGNRFMLDLNQSLTAWLSNTTHEGSTNSFLMDHEDIYATFAKLINPLYLGNAHSNGGQQSNLRLVFFVPQANVLAQAHRVLALNSALAIGGILFIFLLMIFISGRIAGPIQKSVKFAQAVANRDFSQTLNLRYDDEVGQLGKALDSMAATLKAITKQANTIAQGLYTIEMTPVNDHDELGFALQTMTKSLSDASQAVQKVADGDLDIRVDEKSRFDLLAISINKMIMTQKNVADQANTISLGDFSVDIEPRSDKDELGIALQTMTQTLKYVASQANRIASGDYQSDPLPQSEKDELGRALQTMTKKLKEVSLANERSSWFKTGQTTLADIMLGETDIPTLCKNILNFLAKYLDAQVGTLYLTSEVDQLELTASFAFSGYNQYPAHIKPGQGLVGEAFSGKQSIVITELPHDYMKINSSLGQAIPKNLLAVPIIRHDAVKGVIELGSFSQFEDFQIDFINLVAKNIAIAIHSAQESEKTNILLEKSQQQAEELGLKQEELQEKNTKLEEHTIALKVSEETLKIQHEELQATNLELAENSRLLEGQKHEIESAKSVIEQKVHELEEAYQYKSDFLANMSHELRTPLTSLLILAKMLATNEEGNLSPEQQEYAAVILRSGRDLLTHINDILDLSKAETKKLSLSSQKIPINLLLKNLNNQFQPMAQEKELQLNITKADALEKFFQSDMQRVEQILRNLLANALKFTRQGNVTLHVFQPESPIPFQSAHLSFENVIAFSVSDTGIGIARDKQTLIFEAFQQADGSTSRRFGGTGLGLAISKEFATLLGGEIHLQSSKGKGSCFTLYLPLITSSEVKQVNPIETSDPPLHEPIASEPHTCPEPNDDRYHLKEKDKILLIIEDDHDFATILKTSGNQRGYQCLIACDGTSGLKMLNEFDINAVVLDIGLPDMDGYQVLKQMKNNPKTQSIPVQVLSGHDKESMTLPMGVLDFFQKPISSEVMGSLFENFEGFVTKHDSSGDPIFQSKRILLVDDDQRNTYALSLLMKKQGLETITVDTGQAALELLGRDEKIDLIIMDIMMPIMDGHATIKAIRAQHRFDAIPIIALTAKAHHRDRAECLASGACDYLAKPVDENRLFAVMRHWLNQGSDFKLSQIRLN